MGLSLFSSRQASRNGSGLLSLCTAACPAQAGGNSFKTAKPDGRKAPDACASCPILPKPRLKRAASAASTQSALPHQPGILDTEKNELV